MQRRRVLSVGLAGAATGGLSVVSGCSELVDAVQGDLNESRYSVPEDEVPSKEEMGSVAVNEVSQLSIVGYYSVVLDDEFSVFVAVSNDGDRRTSIGEYDWDIEAFDDRGRSLNDGMRSFSYMGSMDSGERSRIKLVPMVAEAGTVARYEISLRCEDPEDAAYCRG
jgi:hypothetical protein